MQPEWPLSEKAPCLFQAPQEGHLSGDKWWKSFKAISRQQTALYQNRKQKNGVYKIRNQLDSNLLSMTLY